MKKSLLMLILLFPVSAPLMAASEGDVYGGFQYALVTYDEDGLEEAEPTALVGRLGRFANENFSIEGRFGFGLQDDTIDVFGLDVDVDVDSLIGVYGVFHSTSQNDTSFYGVFGFTKGEIEGSVSGITVSADESGLSYGFGVNIGSFNIEYMSYLDEDEFDATAISFGFVNQF